MMISGRAGFVLCVGSNLITNLGFMLMARSCVSRVMRLLHHARKHTVTITISVTIATTAISTDLRHTRVCTRAVTYLSNMLTNPTHVSTLATVRPHPSTCALAVMLCCACA